LKTTHIDSKKMKVYGLIEYVEVYLYDFPHIILIMNIMVIDFLDAKGMLLSRSWASSLGGFLSIDLTHAHIPMGNDIFEILYKIHVVKKHVMDLNLLDYHNDCELYVPRQIIEYDPRDFTFAQEDCIDTLLQRTDKYIENLTKFQGK
jgi:hypothetical protein